MNEKRSFLRGGYDIWFRFWNPQKFHEVTKSFQNMPLELVRPTMKRLYTEFPTLNKITVSDMFFNTWEYVLVESNVGRREFSHNLIPQKIQTKEEPKQRQVISEIIHARNVEAFWNLVALGESNIVDAKKFGLSKAWYIKNVINSPEYRDLRGHVCWGYNEKDKI